LGLSIIPLIRPFIYQSITIPILPHKLYALLQAPVPFVVGLAEMPREYSADLIVIRPESDSIQSKTLIHELPRMSKLFAKALFFVLFCYFPFLIFFFSFFRYLQKSGFRKVP
jgi:hypothetical protein